LLAVSGFSVVKKESKACYDIETLEKAFAGRIGIAGKI